MLVPSSTMSAWPALLATWGAGGVTREHRHHAMHVMLRRSGTMRVRCTEKGPVDECAGLVTAPDVTHAIDARGGEVLIVFVEPEHDLGRRLLAALPRSAIGLDERQRDHVLRALGDGPLDAQNVARLLESVISLLGVVRAPRRIDPRVRRLVERLRARAEEETSLPALAKSVGLSPSRLEHVFTDSIGIPLRRWLLWTKLQRATVAIARGASFARAANEAGFSDASHMTRSFARMFGTTPSEIRRRSQFVQDAAAP